MFSTHFFAKTVPLLGGARGGSFMCTERIKRYLEPFGASWWVKLPFLPQAEFIPLFV